MSSSSTCTAVFTLAIVWLRGASFESSCSEDDQKCDLGGVAVGGVKMLQKTGKSVRHQTKTGKSVRHQTKTDSGEEHAGNPFGSVDSFLDSEIYGFDDDGLNFTRRVIKDQGCEGQSDVDGYFADIDNKEDCEAAFRALPYRAKRIEVITRTNNPLEPTGCYSEGFSEHTGFYDRRLNENKDAISIGISGNIRLLCKNTSTMRVSSRFVRVSENGATCQSKGYESINDLNECSAAFHAQPFEKESEKVAVVNYRGQPKGCFSDCFDKLSGFTCRKFNRHRTGSGRGSDGKHRFLICVSKPLVTTTTTTPTRRDFKEQTPSPSPVKYVRRSFAGEKCDGEFREIDDPAKCEEAFSYLRHKAKEIDQVMTVENKFEPKGCYSQCFSEHSGHHCRKFNLHGSAKPIAGNWKHVLCMNTTAHDDLRFVRLETDYSNCKSQSLSDISNLHECEQAFDALKHDRRSDRLHVVRQRRSPRGCFSDCFSDFDGFSCRKFNKDKSGSGEGSDGVSRFVLCETER